MKVLFSALKKYLPDLEASVDEVANVYTLTGFMLNKKIDLIVNGQKDTLLDLEVRQNRADSLGVLGLARELSAYYNIPLKINDYKIESKSNYKLPIQIKAKEAVKRVLAIKISGVMVSQSPDWLKSYLEAYEINSINNLVDLTNFVMLETAHPSHAFDVDLVGGDGLIWEINPSYKKITTLAGEEIELTPETLVISDGEKPLSLSLIGGRDVAINQNTKDIILEIGVYDPALVRRNSRSMKIFTEASSRLEKHLDPETMYYAFSMLVNLILENCGGQITSEIFDEYIKKSVRKEIQVNLDKLKQIAGIEISYTESINYLNRLGFEILSIENNKLICLSPNDRTDINLEEDVFEEVIRLKGYQNIPKNVLTINPTKDITPTHLNVIDRIKILLANCGFDEVRSWVLVDPEKNKKANYSKTKEIKVINSMNEEVPILRQSLAVSLLGQFETFKKNNISKVHIFEEGKVFGKKFDNYVENYSLGILSNLGNLDELRLVVEKVLRSEGLDFISYKRSETIPPVAHPHTCFDIFCEDELLGLIYKSNKLETGDEISIAEIDIDILTKITLEHKNQSTEEILQKLVELDTNIILEEDANLVAKIEEKLKNQTNVWNWEVVDEFKDENEKTKYTIRVTYMHLSDPDAKELHKKIFS